MFNCANLKLLESFKGRVAGREREKGTGPSHHQEDERPDSRGQQQDKLCSIHLSAEASDGSLRAGLFPLLLEGIALLVQRWYRPDAPSAFVTATRFLRRGMFDWRRPRKRMDYDSGFGVQLGRRGADARARDGEDSTFLSHRCVCAFSLPVSLFFLSFPASHRVKRQRAAVIGWTWCPSLPLCCPSIVPPSARQINKRKKNITDVGNPRGNTATPGSLLAALPRKVTAMDILDAELQVETDLTTQSLLLAAANHDIPALHDLLRNNSANVQDPDTGFTPLHAAVAAFEPDHGDDDEAGDSGSKKATNGTTTANTVSEEEMEKATKTVKLLFQNGAIWNDLDTKNETAGCIALRLGLKELYNLIVDAGVRAELLLSRLDEYQLLGGGDDDEDDEEEDEGEEDGEPVAEGQETAPEQEITNPTYLSQPVTITADRVLDDSTNAVMMSWETPIMERSAVTLLPKPGLRVLNVGHGLGIIDRAFQSHEPAAHHIIEAHPDVLARMREQGWHEKPGVVIHEGRWQDVVKKLVDEGVLFDAIYFDTFAEEYKALREFFSEFVIGLLDLNGGEAGEGGRFGFFNGMGADRQVCYDVYSKVRGSYSFSL